jgi:subfamily B ATP-binding cassette protein MsbA
MAFAAVLLLANHYIVQGSLDVATFAALVGALAAASNPTKKIVRGYNVLQESLGAVDRIFDLLNQENEIEEASGAVDLDGVSEGVEFDGVTFAYNDEPVLKDINLYVPKGEVYAIVGSTGAGKSTLLDLLPRFYDPQTGSVKIDGIDVRDIRRESLTDNIAIVGQHPFLFNRTIEENIRYGRREASDEEVRRAARAAHVHEFVESLPEGYRTTVGERGGRLSGGQRQCVTMARAFLKDAPILILDEATSNLDSESEKAVQDALRNLTRDRTTFIIAHRLSTVRYADKIVVMKNGRIVEQGTHEELLERGGEYEKLHRLQFAEPEVEPS